MSRDVNARGAGVPPRARGIGGASEQETRNRLQQLKQDGFHAGRPRNVVLPPDDERPLLPAPRLGGSSAAPSTSRRLPSIPLPLRVDQAFRVLGALFGAVVGLVISALANLSAAAGGGAVIELEELPPQD